MRARTVIAAMLALTLIVVSGCAEARARRQQADHEERKVARTLTAQLSEWKGTRYRMGGLSRSGIDCSGFVYLTFKQRFGMSVPRTTKALARHGRKVRRDRLRAGDLVFFRTGFRKRHVGIYMGDNGFIHASTSNGVMRSSLDNPYWDSNYWQARRVLDL